jgi:hypothetical protein
MRDIAGGEGDMGDTAQEAGDELGGEDDESDEYDR